MLELRDPPTRLLARSLNLSTGQILYAPPGSSPGGTTSNTKPRTEMCGVIFLRTTVKKLVFVTA